MNVRFVNVHNIRHDTLKSYLRKLTWRINMGTFFRRGPRDCTLMVQIDVRIESATHTAVIV